MCEKTLDLGNDYRVNVILDEYAEKPFDESGAPVVSIPFIGHHVYNFDSSDDKYADYIRNFVLHYGKEWDLLERALKIVFGATHIYRFDTRDTAYFVFDPYNDFWTYAPHIRKNIVEGTAKEYEAWVNGECYGIVVEQKITGQKRYNDGRVEDFTEWEELESVWGFYGDWILEDANLIDIANDLIPSQN